MRDVMERFWSKVAKADLDECWRWTAYLNPTGYGQFAVTAREVRLAHRYSWQLTWGPIPPGLFVLHRCDNPPCVNPAHLFLGTNADNMADKVAKGRQRYGVRVNTARLTPEKVKSIRWYRAHKMSQHDVASLFGVAPGTIQAIDDGKSWRSV